MEVYLLSPVQLELHNVGIGDFKFPISKGAVTTL
jgi:hypothetical protein